MVTCKDCGKVMKAVSMHGHYFDCKKKVEGQFQCWKCTERFFSEFELNLHKRTHTGRKNPFNCDHCPIKCRGPANLKDHIIKEHKDLVHIYLQEPAPGSSEGPVKLEESPVKLEESPVKLEEGPVKLHPSS